jgi:hypothetical protein
MSFGDQLKELLVSAPLLCTGFIGGLMSMPGSSCLASWSAAPPPEQRQADASYLARSYFVSQTADLSQSIDIVKRLWTYFVEEAETFTEKEMAVIDKEFWNLG